MRRARGFAPLPITVKDSLPPVLAVGAHQKNTIAASAGQQVFVSQHIGDLETQEAFGAFERVIESFRKLYEFEPRAVACDLHPNYMSSEYARRSGLPVIEVQHHYAHILACMAENEVAAPVLGISWDGSGYGPDGTVWGGEFLIAMPDGFARAGHLKAVTLLGFDASVRQNWKTALCYIVDAGIPGGVSELEKLVRAALTHSINTIRSSSMGRLFDAVSAMLGICLESTYEGQGAVELENAAAAFSGRSGEEPAPLPYFISVENGAFVADMAPCVRALLSERAGGEEAGLLALRFHLTVRHLIADMCSRLREDSGIKKVCLSGGVFQNRLLMEKTVPALTASGFEVYLNEKVPPNDGGIALGQALVACHILKNSEGEGANNVRGCIGTSD
jgi:hydrogenase maturation protein HypF